MLGDMDFRDVAFFGWNIFWLIVAIHGFAVDK